MPLLVIGIGRTIDELDSSMLLLLLLKDEDELVKVFKGIDGVP